MRVAGLAGGDLAPGMLEDVVIEMLALPAVSNALSLCVFASFIVTTSLIDVAAVPSRGHRLSLSLSLGGGSLGLEKRSCCFACVLVLFLFPAGTMMRRARVASALLT